MEEAPKTTVVKNAPVPVLLDAQIIPDCTSMTVLGDIPRFRKGVRRLDEAKMGVIMTLIIPCESEV